MESQSIGENSRVWAFAHILPGAKIGRDCNICDHVFIENDVIVGNRVTIKCGVQLWDGLRIEDDVFVGPNVTFTNDIYPRSKRYPEKFGEIIVRKGASIGANATVIAGVTIGKFAMVGAGAVVTRDVPQNAIVMGSPARIEGYVDSVEPTKAKKIVPPSSGERETISSKVAGVTLCEMPLVADLRGSLSFAEYGQLLPFIPKRYFLVFDVPSKDVRGEHAHKRLHQFLVCVKGSCSVLVDDGSLREEIQLDRPNIGLHIAPLVWAVQYKYSADAVLLVLASDRYDADEYIRDYDVFQELSNKKRP